jgi:hypothetical protein
MVEHNPPSSADSARAPVIPLPVALYVSDGLIFELYDGGQPCRSFSIRWKTKTWKSFPWPRTPAGSKMLEILISHALSQAVERGIHIQHD